MCGGKYLSPYVSAVSYLYWKKWFIGPLKLSYGLCQVTSMAHQVLNLGLKNWKMNRAVDDLDLEADS